MKWWEHEGAVYPYLWCRIVGHRPDYELGRLDTWWCTRCGDVLPEGNKRRQP